MELDELSVIMGGDSTKAALDKAIKAMEEAAKASAAFKEAAETMKYQLAYKKALNNGFIKKESEPPQKPKKKPEPPRPQTFGEWS